ncbi:hypothetical protein HPHPP16_0546 [Helicobacter pylori Hp P-16]|nr:hypothetical protein HPHPP16_0546 [Helicobacter pylori Hp P-16]
MQISLSPYFYRVIIKRFVGFALIYFFRIKLRSFDFKILIFRYADF